MNKELIAIFEYLEREKGIKRDVVIAAIEESLQAAARKSVLGASNVTVTINQKNGNIDVYCEKEIVEDVEMPTMEIGIKEAREIDPDCELGQFIDVLVTPEDFGRIAAQKARQIITRKLRGAERDVIYEEYRHRLNELISGTVKRFVKGSTLIVDLGKVEALLPTRHYPRTERYQIGDKILAVLLEVKDTDNGGAEVILSRSHPEFVKQLLAREVPEIEDGTISIVKIVREAGYRTKLAVRSEDPKVDPVGACVGMRGMRIKNVVRELNNEKIDIIPYAADAVELLQNTLAPIEIRKISLGDKAVSIVVDDDNFAAVIGKGGMNARLTSQLIGYELEVQRVTDYQQALLKQQDAMGRLEDPELDEELKGIEGVNPFIFDSLVEHGYNTLRALLMTTPEKLARETGIGLELADKILEQIRKQRM
jgi:N utilization substance protein A